MFLYSSIIRFIGANIVKKCVSLWEKNSFMMKMRSICILMFMVAFFPALAQDATVTGPDGKLKVDLFFPKKGEVNYTVTYDGFSMLSNSALGLETNLGRYGKRDKQKYYDLYCWK